MYVTRVANGRIVQYFEPRPLFPKFEACHRGAFASLDAAQDQSAAPDRDEQLSLAQKAVLQRRTSLGRGRQSDLVAVAVSNLHSGAPLNKEGLIRANGMITGSSLTNFRRKDVWIGGASPCHALHVGTAPNRISPLMRALLESGTSSLPFTLRAVVVLLRILQIHPFEDGNGRTARLHFYQSMHARFGKGAFACEVLHALWNKSKIDIQAESHSICATEDWSRLFAFVLSLQSPNETQLQ